MSRPRALSRPVYLQPRMLFQQLSLKKNLMLDSTSGFLASARQSDACYWLQTQAVLFNLNGVPSLALVIYSDNSAANAVANNPGHPHLGLYVASGTTDTLVILVCPAWFADGSAFYIYVPGAAACMPGLVDSVLAENTHACCGVEL